MTLGLIRAEPTTQTVAQETGVMISCRKCGSELKFKRLKSGKLSPMNPDGSDHWDLCRSITRKAEGIVVEFHSRTRGNVFKFGDYVWAGDMPPWHTDLGDFRNFTAAEKSAQEVCVRYP
jgi:hypothetical protein